LRAGPVGPMRQHRRGRPSDTGFPFGLTLKLAGILRAVMDSLQWRAPSITGPESQAVPSAAGVLLSRVETHFPRSEPPAFDSSAVLDGRRGERHPIRSVHGAASSAPQLRIRERAGRRSAEHPRTLRSEPPLIPRLPPGADSERCPMPGRRSAPIVVCKPGPDSGKGPMVGAHGSGWSDIFHL